MVNIFYLDEDPAICVQYYHDKQVSIMGTQVAQILHKIHSHCNNAHVNPFKNQNAVKIGLNVCQWILESKENYKYCAAVGYYLIQEYKYRFNKDSHPHEEKIKWLYEHIPQKIPDLPQTPFKLSKNVSSYHIAYQDTLQACKISYIDYKLKPTIKWSKRGKPTWLDESIQKSKQIKTEQLKKLSKMKIEDEYYEKLLGKNWKNNKFMYGKMFDLKGEILGQLESGHLYHLRCIVGGDGEF